MTNLPDYRKLCAIPGSIAASRLNIGSDTRKYAFLLECELIIRFLLLLFWRAETIRSCRLAGPNPNIFKASLRSAEVDAPAWVGEALTADSKAHFWQYSFAASHRPKSVSGFIPQQLVPMLEEYVKNYRPRLLTNGVDPGTLFVAQRGRPFSQSGLRRLIGSVTTCHFSSRLSIRDFRTAVKNEWLRNFMPGGFQTLARMMWHSTPASTARAYLRNYRVRNTKLN